MILKQNEDEFGVYNALFPVINIIGFSMLSEYYLFR